MNQIFDFVMEYREYINKIEVWRHDWMILNVNIIFMEPHRDKSSCGGKFCRYRWKLEEDDRNSKLSFKNSVKSFWSPKTTIKPSATTLPFFGIVHKIMKNSHQIFLFSIHHSNLEITLQCNVNDNSSEVDAEWNLLP